jgi:hypothetical protein
LSYPVPNSRYSQWPLTTVCFGNHDSLDRVRFITLAFQCLGQLSYKNRCPFFGLNVLEGYTVYAGTPFVGSDKSIGMAEDVCPVNLVI